MNVLALDIGGANLKAAHSAGAARSQPYQLWREPETLIDEVESAVRALPAHDLLAVTMTAELCDCFATKREGVLRVLELSEAGARQAGSTAPMRVLRVDGRIVDLDAARADPAACASSNWMALALFGAALLPKGRGVVADIGSTTTDIIPVRNGAVSAGGRTDPDRLLQGELLYTGVRRTPVFAVASELPYHDQPCPVAAEVFATMVDAYLLTGDLLEEPAPPPGSTVHSADGRPLTIEHARDRLARAICADRETFDQADALAAARFLAAAQERKVRQALLKAAERLGGPLEGAVVAGEGEFLLRRAIHHLWPRCEIIPLSQRFDPEASRAACALALAHLAAEPARPALKTNHR